MLILDFQIKESNMSHNRYNTELFIEHLFCEIYSEKHTISTGGIITNKFNWPKDTIYCMEKVKKT
jgi:hypothetical protein